MALETAQHVATAPLERKKRKARWNIETTLRDAAMAQMVMVMADMKSSHAAVCKASALLMRVEAQNQRDEHRKKKKAVKKNVPVVHLAWNGQESGNRSQESEGRGQDDFNAENGVRSAELKQGSQEAGEEISNGPVEPSIKAGRRKRERRWNIKPEYRNLMVLRWSMIVADPKASQTVKFAVVALMLRAEAQNQKDEEHRRRNKNRTPKQIVVGWTRDFYKNNAHVLVAARAAAASSAGSVVAGTKEDRDLRPEVGQDAAGTDRFSPQSWYATGPPSGRG